MTQRVRIFISSPGDVPDERLRADLIIDKLSQDYSRFFTIESYRWEHEAMLASKHFQDAIEPPSAFDIVVLILWSRLGTLLPERTAQREYHGIDGRAPVTGTEWEYEEALKAAREKQAPDLLAFRNVSQAPIDTRDSEARAKSNAQLDALDAFWRRHFVDRGVFLAAYDEYRTLEEFAKRLEESLRKLIERRIKDGAAGVTGTPIWLGEPFRGLEPYEFEHAPIFFGRDAAVMKATEQLAANARSGWAFLLVSGASGSGKSSLVKAGILPRLMKPQRISGAAFRRLTVFRPATGGIDVFLGLATALTRATGPEVGLPQLVAPGQDAAHLATHLRGVTGDPGYLFANALGRVTEAGRKSGRLLAFEEAKLILVVDQFEELFTVSSISAEDRRLFVQLLAGLARSETVWVIATLRADFWHRAMEIPELIALAEGQRRIDLAAASPAELAEMIRKPAQAAGLTFEVHPQTGLGLDVVLAEHAAAAPGALPLLSFTLDELYKDAKARGASVLTHASYEALGGLEGAIASRADETMGSLPAPAQATLPRVLRALTTVSTIADRVPVARSPPLQSFPEGSPSRILVDAFVAARLLVATGEEGAAATVRLAHEALISRWQRARDQLVADRRDLETRTLVEQQFGRWSQARGTTRWLLLLRNPDLANAVDLAKRWGDELDVPIRKYIQQSGRRARVVQTLTAVAAVLFAFVAGAAIYAERQATRERESAVQNATTAEAEKVRAEQNLTKALLAQSRFLAAHAAQQIKSGDAGGAALLALEALLPDDNGAKRPYTAEADRVLSSALQQLREIRVFAGAAGPISSANFSPNGKRILTTSEDGTGRIYETGSGKTIALLNDHQGGVLSGAFSQDGRWIATGSVDGIARIWNAETGEIVSELKGHRGPVFSAAFSSDGRRVVTASSDGSARIWDVATTTPVDVLNGHTDRVLSATFSPDGSQVATASDDYTARVWDVATSSTVMIFEGHAGPVNSAVFSTDGRRLVTASDDKTIRLWNVETGATIAVLEGHEAPVQSARLETHNDLIVSASRDETARIWDFESGALLAILRGHGKGLRDAAFSPDGDQVVTASDDRTARLWNVQTMIMASILGHSRAVFCAAFSPDGRRLVTGSGDGTARVWEAATGNSMSIFPSGTDPVLSVAFSPDGHLLAASSYDGTARVWDLRTKGILATLEGHKAPVFSAAFSPDGRRVVTASTDGTVRIWDAETGKPILTLGQEFGDRFYRAAFSPDGRRVVGGSETGPAYIWDIQTAKAIMILGGHDGPVFSAAFSSDGRRVITASGDKTARIWDAATGDTLGILKGHDAPVLGATFSPDGNLAVTASWDKTVRIWNAATYNPLVTLSDHSEPVFNVAFSRDGRYIVTASRDKTARIYDIEKLTEDSKNTAHGEILIERAEQRAPRCLDKDERLAVFLDPDPPAWCIELGKWPYDNTTWRGWLANTRSGLKLPRPDTVDWQTWRTNH